MTFQPRYVNFAYAAVDHCTGRRWVSQWRALCECAVRVDLRAVYGSGIEILSINRI